MEETSAVNVLDNGTRTISRRSLRRSRESRSAAGAGKIIDKDDKDTVVLLKLSPCFRKADNDLGSFAQSVSSLSKWRAITIRWISDVPSPISQIFASRIIRSTG
jgi:hypothetical protein